jgi:hypothetical protein
MAPPARIAHRPAWRAPFPGQAVQAPSGLYPKIPCDTGRGSRDNETGAETHLFGYDEAIHFVPKEETPMKSFLLACAIAIIIAASAGLLLNNIQEPVAEAFSTTGVRLGT